MNEHPLLVTGATDGIGFETALALARMGRPVFVHGRTSERASRACEELARQVPGARVRPVWADYSRLDEVRALGHRFQNEGQALGGVVHNAGAVFATRSLTEDGWESTWQVNHLAPFLLHSLLAPLLVSGVRSRTVWLTSMLHAQGRLPWDDFNRERSYSALEAYNASKLANILTAFRIARGHAPSYLASFAVHPGVVGTKLLRQFTASPGASPADGARTSVFAAVDPALERKTGLYLVNRQPAEASAEARDEELQDRLWDWTATSLAL